MSSPTNLYTYILENHENIDSIPTLAARLDDLERYIAGESVQDETKVSEEPTRPEVDESTWDDEGGAPVEGTGTTYPEEERESGGAFPLA